MRNLTLLLCMFLWAGVATAGDKTMPALSADQVYAEYEANAVAADAKYKGKKVTITGTIRSIGTDITGQVYVTLGSAPFQGVQCTFPDNRKASVMKLSKGQEVTISGKIQGMLMLVQLENAKLIE